MVEIGQKNVRKSQCVWVGLELSKLRITCQHFSPAIYQIRHMVKDSLLILTAKCNCSDQNGLTRKHFTWCASIIYAKLLPQHCLALKTNCKNNLLNRWLFLRNKKVKLSKLTSENFESLLSHDIRGKWQWFRFFSG